MADITEVLRIVVDVVAERNAAVRERDAARAEVAAIDAAISDRGVAVRDCRLPVAERIDNILVELKEWQLQFRTAAMENERLCAQLQADDQRAWEALGKPEGTHETTNVQRLCAEVERLRAERAELRRMSKWHDEIADSLRAEVERLRADLREAMELLRAHGQPPDWLKLGDAADWNTRYGALLAKHKDAADG